MDTNTPQPQSGGDEPVVQQKNTIGLKVIIAVLVIALVAVSAVLASMMLSEDDSDDSKTATYDAAMEYEDDSKEMEDEVDEERMEKTGEHTESEEELRDEPEELAAGITYESEINDAVELTEGVEWLPVPEMINDFGVSLPEFSDEIAYKVAELDNGGMIVYVESSLIGKTVGRFVVDSLGKMSVLLNHSDVSTEDALQYTYDITKFTVDADTTYPELTAPETMTVDGLKLEKFEPPFLNPGLYGIPDSNSEFVLANPDEGTVELLEENEYGTVYKYTYDLEGTEEDDNTFEVKRYYLRLADTSLATYTTAKDFFADDNSVVANWTSGGKDFEDRTYFGEFLVREGCGGIYGDQLLADGDISDLLWIGSTDAEGTNQDLFTTYDRDSRLLISAYETYKFGRTTTGDNAIIPFEEFAAAGPLLVWQDASGDYSAFLDNTYAPLVECGKPVVYLYPEQETEVSVQVGADVTISEPEYGNGWTTTAYPSGRLVMEDGAEYGNLYWEGTGYGPYPEIDFGRVVKSENIEGELRHDLAAQGMNETETKDFLEFWLPHMPEEPYVRLSWFTTQQMNALAPLRVYPMPQSVKRVFLDFEGLETSEVELKPQVLTSFERNGFTLVEWGGLLVGGHIQADATQ